MPYRMTTAVTIVLLAGAAVRAAPAAPHRVEVKAAEFVATKYLTPQQQEAIRKTKRLRGVGEATYAFTVPAQGWYELWIEAATWPTDLYLDGRLLIHTSFPSGVWKPRGRRGRLEKVLNLHLKAGAHKLTFSRTWHPGLPFMSRFVVEAAKDVTGMVRLALQKDYLVFRRGEAFPVTLRAGRGDQPYTLTLTLTDPHTGKRFRTIEQTVPAGRGVYEQALDLPTEREGVLDVTIVDARQRPVDRALQYLVVDTRRRPATPAKLTRQLVQTIDCATRKPDYGSGRTRVVRAAIGAYRESGTRGHVEYRTQADWFAYTLDLPDVQEPYLVEIDYPDDDERTFTYSIVERELPGGRALTHGVAGGGMYSLSGTMQTAQMIFYPRQRDPRLHFRTWWTGQRAAAARVRVYRTRAGFPALVAPDRDGGRRFGRYQEEPIRFVQWGARPEGNVWRTLWEPAERIGQYSRWVGINLWCPTIAIYGAAMWPSRYLPSLDHDCDAWGVIGPYTTKEPVQKDVVRLMLLVGEKYGLDLAGELFMPAGRPVARRYFEDRFGGDGTIEWKDPNAKPWLIVHRNGASPGTPLYNPLYAGIQDWVADIVGELARRYKDSPAMKGVAVRFMGWQFHGWQGFPSIHWGYGDCTIALFEKETGTQVPVRAADPKRFQKRHDWLMANAYARWVGWRCHRIYQYHQRLASILTGARADLKLYLNLYGPNYGHDAEPADWEQKGWAGLIRETGIDLAKCRANPAILLRAQRHYPPGIRGTRSKDWAVRASLIRQFYEPTPIEETAEPVRGGTVSVMHFDANSYESNMVRTDALGLGKHLAGNPRAVEVHGAGLVFPAGRHFLERYANAMADGNVVRMDDGSHGYIMLPPDLLRRFTAEYRVLPAVGMTRLKGTGDPVALWHGTHAGRSVFYLVNRLDRGVKVNVQFDARAQPVRLSTGEALPLGDDGRLHRNLAAYELIAVGNRAPGTPVALSVRVDKALVEQVKQQLDFVGRLLAWQGPAAGATIVPFSLVDHRRAKQKLARARAAATAGRYAAVRRLLLDAYLVKVYEAFDAWPPHVWQRKAPAQPEQAMGPSDLLGRADDAGRNIAAVVPADRIAPQLAGRQVLSWRDKPIGVSIDSTLDTTYRVSFGYVSRAPYARPTFGRGEHTLPGQDKGPTADTGLWGKRVLLAPVRLPEGRHNLRIAPARGAGAALFWVHVEPLFRDLVARDWHVIGPFPSEPRWRKPGTGLDTVFGPEKVRNFDAAYKGDRAQELTWVRPESNDAFVNLHKITGAYQFRVSYAVTTIRCPEARKARLKFGVDYWAKIWLNGKRVFAISEGHGAPCPRQFDIPIELKRGANELLLKVHAGSAGNAFWLAISDPGDLQVSPVAPGQSARRRTTDRPDRG